MTLRRYLAIATAVLVLLTVAFWYPELRAIVRLGGSGEMLFLSLWLVLIALVCGAIAFSVWLVWRLFWGIGFGPKPPHKGGGAS
jgi:hypothetical protein